MSFKLYNSNVSVTVNGVTYNFIHVDSVVVEDPERTRLVRGSNAGNKTGLVYKEGLKEAKTITVTVMALEKALHDLLKSVYANQTRVDVNVIDKTDGATKIAKNSVLSQEPKQLTLDDSAESMNVALIFESFDVSEVLKT